MDFSPFWISLKVAFCATLLAFVLGLAAARLVSALRRGRFVLDGILSLPMVLPPTVVGFFLLLLFGNRGILGRALALAGVSVLFTWQGAVISAAAVSFPLLYRTARGAFEQVDPDLVFAARTLGMGELRIFFRILLPAAWPGVMAGTVLAFARAMGEFGATVMLAGNIPGRTQTMSIAVYSAVQGGNRALAYRWVCVILAISFATLLLLNLLTERQKTGRRDSRWRFR